MDNKTQSILQKFSAQKVDLNIKTKLDTILNEMVYLMNEIDIDVSNADQTINKFEPVYKEIQKYKQLSDSIKKTLRQNGNKLVTKVKESYRIQKEAENYAKELGIEPNKIPNYRDVKVRTKYYDEFAQSAFSWETELINGIDKKIK